MQFRGRLTGGITRAARVQPPANFCQPAGLKTRRGVQRGDVGERALRPSGFGNPRRMLEHRADDADEVGEREGV
jgi:hypothetical protein